MPDKFKYQAISTVGTISRGEITAVDDLHVEEFLSEQDLRPISITRIKKHRPLALFGFFNSHDTEDLIMVTNGLATMQRAGVPLIKALGLLRVGSKNDRLNEALEHIRLDVQGGRPLSEAMAEYESLFSPVYTAAVSAGEESGQLEQTLNQLSDVLETEMELNRQVRMAMRYPMIVVTIIMAAFLVLMTFVIPKFVDFFSAFGAELPLPTRILIGASTFFTSYWYVMVAIAGVGIYSFRRLISTVKGRLWFDRQLLKLPAIGNIIAKGNIARFALMFRILFNAGIPLVRTLEILTLVVKNTVISGEIRKLGELFRQGRDLGRLAGEFKVFPELALNMLSIGMESGSLDQMTKELGKHYTKDALYRSRQLTSVIEPILTIILGVFILIMALAIFLPMWGLIKVFQGG